MIKNLNIAAIISILIFALSGCSMEEQNTTNQTREESNISSTSSDSVAPVLEKITAEKAKEMMDSDQPIILDVRTTEEYEEGHIEGAILIPDNEISAKAEELLTDKNATILVYCRSGRRSAHAAQDLSDLGYTKIYDFGGIIDWPYDVVAGK
ncbi:MAG: Rhodanese-like protein [Firmicutes bacterium]|nr:Rhodanese-like protein [Bacillota bacterium]